MEKLQTGVPGLDVILRGGLLRGALVLVAGAPGAGKTILTTQIAFHLASGGGRVLMLTALSEATSKLIAHLDGLRYFDPGRIGSDIEILNIQRLVATDGLDATLTEIRAAVLEKGTDLLVLDSLRSLDVLTGDPVGVQNFIFSLGSALFMLGCTTILVEDQYSPEGSTTRERAISDTILQLDVARSGRSSPRLLEVVKMRGGAPLGGRHSFSITDDGVRVFPRLEALGAHDDAERAGSRLSWGVAGLDEITGGGAPDRSSTLLAAPGGGGKTTFGLQFALAGLRRGEPCLYASSHESASQLRAKAAALCAAGAAADPEALAVMPLYAPGMDVDETAHAVLTDVRERGVRRVVLDGVETLERSAAREDRFADVLHALLRSLRAAGATTLLTRGSARLYDEPPAFADPDAPAWSALDNVMLVRTADAGGVRRRMLTVLKMRGSDHDDALHGFRIAGNGIALDGVPGDDG